MVALTLLMGHLFGDYVFQNTWMAANKTKGGLNGWFSCFIHSSIYSTCIIASFLLLKGIGTRDMVILWSIVFVAHYPIDKLSLAKYWLSLMGRKTPKTGDIINDQTILWFFVYIITDNTLHIALSLLGVKLFVPHLLI